MYSGDYRIVIVSCPSKLTSHQDLMAFDVQCFVGMRSHDLLILAERRVPLDDASPTPARLN